MSQRFSLAVHQHPDHVAGIAYRCRHDNEQIAWALFERSAPLFDRIETPPDTLDEDDDWLGELEERYGLVID